MNRYVCALFILSATTLFGCLLEDNRYRVSELTFESPGLFHHQSGEDVDAAGLFEGVANQAIAIDDAIYQDDDDLLDLSILLAFGPSGRAGFFGPADCKDAETCEAIEPRTAFRSRAETSGECSTRDGTISVPAGDHGCFAATVGDAVLPLAFVELHLMHMEIVGQFTEGRTGIVNGTITGFMPESVADATLFPESVTATALPGLRFADFLRPESDLVEGPDGEMGYVFVFGFSANDLTHNSYEVPPR